MRLPIIISTYNRFGLLKQTLDSVRKNSDNELEIVVVCDNLDEANPDLVEKRKEYLDSQKDVAHFYFGNKATIAQVKRQGFSMVSKQPYVYFSDDDVYFEPHWDTKLIKVLKAFPQIGVVGGLHHSHHKIFSTRKWKKGSILICEQQAGYSLMLRREDYLLIGGYEVSERTKDGGEDTLVCDMIKEKGKLVATVDPPVIVHCGLYNYRGLLAAGYEGMQIIKSQRPEILFE